jgi:hypothetical protein
MSQLAEASQSSRSRLSHAVARLEERGWLRREVCPTDKRGQLAVLTAEGFAALEAAAPGHVEAVREALFDPLTPAQVRQLREISEAVLRAWTRPPGPTAPETSVRLSTGTPRPAGGNRVAWTRRARMAHHWHSTAQSARRISCRRTSTPAPHAATTSTPCSRSRTRRSRSAPECRGRLRKIFSSVGVVFKGLRLLPERQPQLGGGEGGSTSDAAKSDAAQVRRRKTDTQDGQPRPTPQVRCKTDAKAGRREVAGLRLEEDAGAAASSSSAARPQPERLPEPPLCSTPAATCRGG